MKAMILKNLCSLAENPAPLDFTDVSEPVPGEKELLIKVDTCGVCHTELDEIEGRTPPSELPLILGHQVVGFVAELGSGSDEFEVGDRVGVAWIFSACGNCHFCLSGRENLCPEFKATGRDVNGGYAEYMTVSKDFAHPLPAVFTARQAAPLLCAGAIGYRSLQLTGLIDGQKLGLTGFGASAHLVLKMVKQRYPNLDVFVFARSPKEQEFAIELGAVWSGDTMDIPPSCLDAIIDTTPVWKTVVEGLKNLLPGGRMVINAIRKEDYDKDYLLNLDYPTHLWLEKEIKSVANVCRSDVREFLNLAAEIPLTPEVQEFALDEANTALMELKQRQIHGAKVLRIGY